VHALTDDEVRLLVLDHLQPAREVADLALDRRHLLLVVNVHHPVHVEAAVSLRRPPSSRDRLAPAPDLVAKAVRVPSGGGGGDAPRALRLADVLEDLDLAWPDDLGLGLSAERKERRGKAERRNELWEVSRPARRAHVSWPRLTKKSTSSGPLYVLPPTSYVTVICCQLGSWGAS
jgi:hypothetical protein